MLHDAEEAEESFHIFKGLNITLKLCRSDLTHIICNVTFKCHAFHVKNKPVNTGYSLLIC